MSLVKFCFLAVTEHPSHEAVFTPLRPIAVIRNPIIVSKRRVNCPLLKCTGYVRL